MFAAGFVYWFGVGVFALVECFLVRSNGDCFYWSAVVEDLLFSEWCSVDFFCVVDVLFGGWEYFCVFVVQYDWGLFGSGIVTSTFAYSYWGFVLIDFAGGVGVCVAWDVAFGYCYFGCSFGVSAFGVFMFLFVGFCGVALWGLPADLFRHR